MIDFEVMCITSYPKRYAPVISATIFSSLGKGYEITSSFVRRISLFAEIEIVSCPVSNSTCVPLSRLLATTHSFGSETRMLLPILCRRLMNLANLYQFN